MFIVPCKFTNQSQLYQCLSAINTHHPEEKILVVDSNSDDKSYFGLLANYKNTQLADKINSNYEAGALWIGYEQFPNEDYYVLIHDSLIIKNPISKFLEDDQSYSFMYFPEFVQDPLAIDYISKVISLTDYNFKERHIIGTLGNMCILKKNIITNFVNKGLNKVLFPKNKLESQMGERIIGMCLTQEGVDLTQNNIEGNFLSRVGETHGNLLHYFHKIFNVRQ
jgi:hypothetical protein